MPKKGFLAIGDLRGGRNGSDPPVSLPDNQCVEAVNVEWWRASLARKRNGCSAVSQTFSAGGPFTTTIQSLIRHQPSAVETAQELWAIDSAVWGRMAGATTFAAPTKTDAGGGIVQGCSFNGKLFLTYDTSVDRLHVWDGASVRRVGLATPSVPTVADQGSGSYTATLRYYKIAMLKKTGSTVDLRSELSSAVAFTPSGSGTSARLTAPAYTNEANTHWEVYGSADGSTYYLLTTLALATTTYDDTAAPSSYSGTVAPETGLNTVPSSWKYLCATGNRLLGAGSWESGGKNNRVWFTPVIGALDVGDDERVPNTSTLKNHIDLDENDGGFITGFVGSFQGMTLVFKQSQVWKLIPTGIDTKPYRAVCITKACGALDQRAIVEASDENGNPCVYFLDRKGPYRLGVNGIEYCGRDIEDLWLPTPSTSVVLAFGVYHSDKRQVWFWRTTLPGTGNETNLLMVLDTRQCRVTDGGVRGGWATYTGPMSAAYCAVMFSYTRAASMSITQVPHIAASALATPQIVRCDDSARTVDVLTTGADSAFQAYVKTKPYVIGLGKHCGFSDPHLDGYGSATVTIGDALGSKTASVALGVTSDPYHVQVAGFDGQGRDFVQLTMGDASALSSAWRLDRLTLPYWVQEDQ